MSRNPDIRSFFTYRMPFGHVTIGSDGAHVVRVALGDARMGGVRKADPLTNECANQLLEYMSGKRTMFDVPLFRTGSDFQMAIWDAMAEIPYAQTRTAAEVAASAGRPGSYRMVGSAIRENPLIILVPAHRIVPSDGHIDKHDPHAKLRAAFRELELKFA